MRMTRPITSPAEEDCFTSWRAVYCYLNNQHGRGVRSIKRQANRRERRQGKREAQRGRTEAR